MAEQSLAADWQAYPPVCVPLRGRYRGIPFQGSLYRVSGVCHVTLNGIQYACSPAAPAAIAPHPGSIQAPMSGTLAELAVFVGQVVEEGQLLARLESMKLVLDLHAPSAGTLRAIHTCAGQQVAAGDPLFSLEAYDPD